MITIRVGTYNILDGAGDGRAGQQAAMLAAEGLDLLVVSECTGPGWEPGGEIRRAWEDPLGMWSRGELEPDDGDVPGRHCVIFGRHGHLRPGTYRPPGGRPHAWRGSGLLEATVEGYPHVITVPGIHGHTFSPEIRAAEARLAARCFIGAPGPAIVAGDRNSIHGRPAGPRWAHLPSGDPEPDWAAVDPARLICHWLLDANGNPVTGEDGQMICDRRPSHLMTAAGFRDVVAELVPDPAARPATAGFEPGDTPRRIDGISVRHLTATACQTPAPRTWPPCPTTSPSWPTSPCRLRLVSDRSRRFPARRMKAELMNWKGGAGRGERGQRPDPAA